MHVEHAERLAAHREQRDRAVAVVGERALEAGQLRAQVVEDPPRADAARRIARVERDQRGEVVLETRGGRVDAVAVRSPRILQAAGATYAQSADWGVEEAEGFIRLFGMSSTLWAQVNGDGSP